jgi:hypothetical protein
MATVDITVLQQFLTTVGSPAEDLIFGTKPGEFVYHYTDLTGVLGIAQKHDVWLTDARYLNDDQEMLHGAGVVEKVIRQVREEAAGDAPRLDYLDKVQSELATTSEEGVYIACFCFKDDLLSQWRGYGANGTGVSIELDPRQFEWVTGADSPHRGLMRFWKVFYNPDTQRSIIRTSIDYGFSQQPPPPIEERALRAAAAIRFFIPTFKNQGFEEEKECRLIYTPPPGLGVRPEHRVTRGMLIPYYSLNKLSGGLPNTQGKLPILGVRVGPSTNQKVNVESVRGMLADAGYIVPVKASPTSYRG